MIIPHRYYLRLSSRNAPHGNYCKTKASGRPEIKKSLEDIACNQWTEKKYTPKTGERNKPVDATKAECVQIDFSDNQP